MNIKLLGTGSILKDKTREELTKRKTNNILVK